MGSIPPTTEFHELTQLLKQSRSLEEIQGICPGKEKQEGLIASLIHILEAEEMSLRWKAAVALRGIGQPAVEFLIPCLKHEKACVRGSAAWTLGTIGDQRAVEALILLLEDGNEDVRREAVEALGKLGDSRASGPLRDKLTDMNKVVRSTAESSLKALLKKQ